MSYETGSDGYMKNYSRIPILYESEILPKWTSKIQTTPESVIKTRLGRMDTEWACEAVRRTHPLTHPPTRWAHPPPSHLQTHARWDPVDLNPPLDLVEEEEED